MANLKRKRLLHFEKYKAITEVESGAKPSNVATKYGVPRNTISTWLPREKKKKQKKFKMFFNLVRLSTKRKNVRFRQNEN